MITRNVTPIQIPTKNTSNIEASKSYVFNETGNIIVVSTSGNEMLPVHTTAVFNDVAEFYFNMIKTISTTIDSTTKKPYSIYSFDAIMNSITNSGNFVNITSEDVQFTTNSYGATFSKELIEALLGFSTGTSSFAEEMICSIGNEGLKLASNINVPESKVGNIFFVCEYLQGLTSISAIVINCDAKLNKQVFNIGPCYKESSSSTSLIMRKDIYMFSLNKSK